MERLQNIGSRAFGPHHAKRAGSGGTMVARALQRWAIDAPSFRALVRAFVTMALRGQLYRTRIPRYVTGFRIPHKTGDFLPYIGNDVGVLEAEGRTIVVSIFTANHFGSSERLEGAIGRVAEQVADYYTYRQ